MKKNKIMMMVLCIMMLISNFTFVHASSTQYLPEEAVKYAEANWDNGEGVCDEYVKECLKAGGIEILAGGVEPLMNALEDAGYGKKINVSLDEKKQYINKADNPQLEAGDPLFIYCNQCEKWLHTMFITGFDENGRALVDAHNPAWQGIMVFGNFTHTLENGEKHTGDCTFAAVHMDTSHMTCSHEFVGDLIEIAHPHVMYAECKHCGVSYDLGWNANQVSICWECFPPLADKPVLSVQANSDETAILLTWSTVVNAESFNVYRSKNGYTYYQLNTSNGVTVPVTATSFTNKSIEKNQVYYYKVEAVTSTGTIMSDPVSLVIDSGEPLKAPVISIRLNAELNNKPQIYWTHVAGALGYRVYRSDSETGIYELMRTTEYSSYTNEGAEAGKTYYYKVEAYNDEEVSELSNIVSITLENDVLDAPVIHTAQINPSYGKPQIKWNKVEGATSYEIYRSESETTGFTKVSTSKNLSYTNTGAELNKVYYYKMKAVGETTSEFSNTVKIDLTR